jgi:hypothetical protein
VTTVRGARRAAGVSRVAAFALSSILLVSVWACGKKAPPAVEGPKPGGVFADVIEAIDKIKATSPEQKEPDGDIGRYERGLVTSARKEFLVPPAVSETMSDEGYYGGEGTGGEAGDPLDVILDAEWDEYKSLAASAAPGEPSPELRSEVEKSLDDLYRDLPTLMDATPAGPLRERVIHIVTLRYYNTILRAGVDPGRFIGSSGR